jgi:tRNA threonylcarbamoyl adenosine modification protein YeaZ
MIIAIDAASTDLSVAIADPDGAPMGEIAWISEQRQSAEILPRLLELLDRHARSLPDTSAIGVGTGPGSFTGLRVAMALGKGLATSLRTPIVGIPSLSAWLDAEPDAALALARAGAREAYVADREGAAVKLVQHAAIRGLVIGRVVVAPMELARALQLDGARSPRGAGAMARRCALRLADDPGGDDRARLEPIYLRAPRGVAVEAEGAVTWL